MHPNKATRGTNTYDMKSFTGSSSTNSSSSSALLSSFLAMEPAAATPNNSTLLIPHQEALYRVVDDDAMTSIYVIDIALSRRESHELRFTPQQFDFCQKLFAILDTESRGCVDRSTVQEFVTLRCPVFCRRDEDLSTMSNRTTFDEVWKSVVESSRTPEMRLTDADLKHSVGLGVEGWMVFCRFIALAQYLEAKRRFSARHLQQTMRHRNSPRGSEVVVVDVPPPEPPAPLSREQLARYERKNQSPLPLPELDLDHSLVAAHDLARRRASSNTTGAAARSQHQGTVKISLFGSSSHHHNRHHHDYSVAAFPSSSSSSNQVEFKVSYTKTADCEEADGPIVVRRSMEDMKWLNDTFKAHKVLGGTLCGRILPPFPGSNGKILASQFQRDDLSIQKTTGGAIAAAAAGVEIIKDVAKSFWKSESSKKKSSKANPKKAKAKKTKSPSLSLALPESYYNPNSPAGKARQVERYLNYLLEHPALSTSFPLNTILKASQSGLEAAKQSLEECLRLSKEVKEETPQMTDGKGTAFWGSTMQSVQPSLSWVRTAAQAAMALKVHGILETTGMQSASAMLQHASLPHFHEGPKNLDWVDEAEREEEQANASGQAQLSASDRANSFEQGVVSVQSELQAEVRPPNDDDGYDMLPLPVPAPERSILSAGSRTAHSADASASRSTQSGRDPQQTRFHYGASAIRRRLPTDEEDDGRATFLGDISETIGSLREVIGSVDNTLSRCLASSGGIGRARREQGALHLSIVQGFDSWIGLRGKFIGQRALLKGVSGIDQSNEVYEESDLALIDDVSWQASLANSAVSAAEDVRSAVRAAKTAENAKDAASAAAFAAQSVCDAGGFPSIDEARAAQTRASIAQSHAFHAAVVDHEAKAVKRRATLALAHDVKCWNVHRKREMLQACLAHARSQHEATRRAVDAWSCLRDGYIGSSALPSAQTRKASPTVQSTPSTRVSRATASPMSDLPRAPRPPLAPAATALSTPTSPIDLDLPSVDAFADLFGDCATSGMNQSSSSGLSAQFSAQVSSHSVAVSGSPQQESELEEPTATTFIGNIVAVDHHDLSREQQPLPPMPPFPPPSPPGPMAKTSEHSVEKNLSSDNAMLPFAQSVLPLVTAAPVAEVSISKEEPTSEETPKPPEEQNESLSASMASLVDGLMSWGGQFETDDVLALPQGMAASIAFEETLSSPQSPF